MKLAVGASIHPLSWDGGGGRAKRRSEKVILGSPLGVADSVEVREQHRNDENVRDLTSQKSRRPSLAYSTIVLFCTQNNHSDSHTFKEKLFGHTAMSKPLQADQRSGNSAC